MIRKAFTLPELIVVMGVLFTLLAFSSVNLLGSRHKASLNSTVTSLVSDLRLQQLKSILGDTEGRSSADSYGIYFGSNSYTLFHGSTYSAGSADNVVINIETGLSFSNVSLPGSYVVFSRGSGEFAGYNSSTDTFELSHSSAGLTKLFTINQYGVVAQVD